MIKVKCYRNLRYKGVVWSVVSQKTGRVIDRSKEVYLSKVRFVVSQAGRNRVLREKRKNVHATVRGFRLKSPPKKQNWIRVYYHVYGSDKFITEKGPIEEAKYVKLTPTGCWASA